MRHGTAFVAMGLLVAIVGHACADDLNPPEWRTDPAGQNATTLQVWEFGTDANPAAPDLVANEYGAPLATIQGTFPATRWKSEDQGHFGVWKFEESMVLEIPNSPTPNEYKELWIQVTYYSDEGLDPSILTIPDATEVEVIANVPLDDWYRHGTYRVRIEPNPDSETVYITPALCTLYVDEVVVDTICIPEPAAVALLAVGLLVLRRR